MSFENLATGQVRADPRSQTTNINLDSAGLSSRVCAPLKLPALQGGQGVPSSTMWGSITRAGLYDIVTGDSGMYLEQCGSHLHERLTSTSFRMSGGTFSCPAFACPPAINRNMVLWQARSGENVIHGIFLSNRRRFTVELPTGFAAGAPLTMALAGSKLYLSTDYGPAIPSGVWMIPTPTQGLSGGQAPPFVKKHN